MPSIGMLRFQLLALKGSAGILLRSGRGNEAVPRLRTIAQIDLRDSPGSPPVLEVVDRQSAAAPEPLD